MNARHSARPASRRTGLSETPASSRRLGPAALVLLAATILAVLAIAPVGAAAAAPEAFWTRCAAGNESDIACSGPRGVATAPASAGPGVAGHVFVADSFASRIVEFSPWGRFVKTWGQDVVQSGPDDAGSGFEICAPANGDVCKKGTAGTGAGQLSGPQGVAVDSAGNVYVLDRGLPSNNRVQKFDPEGHFLRMWGGGVNSGTSGNSDLCTDAGPPTDVCKAGTEGAANGQFGELSVVGSYIAIDTLGTASAADDKVYVGDQERIQRFDTNGAYQSQIAIPGEKVRALAVDPAGNLYASFCGAGGSGCAAGVAAKANVRKWSSAGLELGTVTVANPQALATDAAGELFVADGIANPTIRQFSSAGSEVPGFAFKDGFSESTGIATGSACLGSGYDLYASNAQESPKAFLRAYGPVPDEAHLALCPPPLHAPEIAGQATLVVQADRATVQGEINPKFWPDTSYYVQYATAACIEGGGWEASCVSQEPAAPAQLGVGASDSPAQTAKIELTGLAPATEYAYRFVAESSGGGPVHGRGGTETEDGDVAVFTTTALPTSPAADSCPNRDFRGGPASVLPDCRAYELVSPIDKNGGDIVSPAADGYLQASPDGNRLTYNTVAAFGDQPSSKLINQYLATREEGIGWQTHGINAPLDRQLSRPGESPIYAFREATAFSPDLCNEWLVDYNVTPLSPGAQPGYTNLYRQDLCGPGGFEALTTTEPAPGAKPIFYVNRYALQGLTADGAHAFFVAEAGLTPEAVPGETNTQIYERSGGGLHLVSVLRSGAADPGSGTFGGVVGGGVAGVFGGNLEHAVSGDGSRVYWTSHASRTSKGGKLYLRENPDRPQSALVNGGAQGSGDLSLAGTTVTNANVTFGEFAVGQSIVGSGIPPETTIVAVNPGEGKLTLSAAAGKSQAGVSLEAFSECSEAERACTVEVSPGEEATFWAATPDGSAALYSEGMLEEEGESSGLSDGTLYRFDAESRTRSTLAEGVMGVLGASEDLSRIYFVSTDALTGAQENGEGDKARAGKPNLYLDEEGTLTFVATLLYGAGGDIFRETGLEHVYSLTSFNPHYRAVRVTPDGSHLLFESRAPLTGYDNADAISGKADVEVFAYEAGGALHCVSCNPSGARPRGSRLPEAFEGAPTNAWGAAWIPTVEHDLRPSNVLSENGRRLFFLSRDGWLPADTNGVQDVYEWEAPGEGSCTKESTAFHKANGGCVYLISSGESPEAAEFWEASADGRDVFFTTGSSLLPQDPGHADVYDARAGGGFPQPVPPPQCEGENCQSAPPPPVDPTLSSASFKGAGNPKKASKPRCAKNKRQVRKAGKTRCVAKHKRRHKRNDHRNAAHKRNADRNRRTAR